MSSAARDRSAARRNKRPYGIACIPCKLKKRSCDGAKPRCRNCASTNEDCVIRLPNRPLRQVPTPSPESSSSQTAQPSFFSNLENTLTRLTNHVERLDRRLQNIEEGHSFYPAIEEDNPMEPFRDQLGPVLPAEMLAPKYRLTVAGDGSITYHGITGWESGADLPSASVIPPSGHFAPPVFPLESFANPLPSESSLTPIFQTLATSKHISVAPELGDALLTAYNCYETFEYTHHASFLRDMVLGGPAFSECLLMVLYACASRMIDGLTEEQKIAQGDLFVKLAKAYLIKEMDGPTKITTIQALLLLSGRECALGEVSQGWNHAGFAFRMIQDLGIHHAPESISGVSNLSIEDQTTRDRLFWAAFVWDKVLSLALGREPTLPPRPGGDPSTLPDFIEDDEIWMPYFTHPLNCPPSLQSYAYASSRRSTCFRLLAQLCIIVHDILVGVYSYESRDDMSSTRSAFIMKTKQRLDRLWEAVPERMRNDIHPSPPPHIFSFLMFFHASYILLYRPTLRPQEIGQISGNAATCHQQSLKATELASSFNATFGARMSTLPRYAWFVAARFDLTLLGATSLSQQIAALERLENWLLTMEKNLVRAPTISRSFRHVSESVQEFLANTPAVAGLEIGRRISDFLLEHGHVTPILPMSGQPDAFAPEDFSLFDMFQSG